MDRLAVKAAAAAALAVAIVSLSAASATGDPAGPSGGPSYVAYTTPAQAFDGNPDTYWQGSYNTDLSGTYSVPPPTATWKLVYGYSSARHISRVEVDYAVDDRFIASNAHVDCSTDGTTWATLAPLPPGQTPAANVSASCQAVRVTMGPQGNGYSPAVAEVTIASSTSAPPTPPRFLNPTAVAAIGDSITLGQYSPISWPSELPIWLPVPVTNVGISGNTTEQMLGRFTDATSIGAQMIVIMGGTNDCQFGWPTTRSMAAIESMASQAIDAGSEPVLVGPLPRDNVPAPCLLSLRAAISAYASTAGLRFVDPWATFELPAGSGQIDPTLTVDGVHPSARGAFVLARVIAHTLGWGYTGD